MVDLRIDNLEFICLRHIGRGVAHWLDYAGILNDSPSGHAMPAISSTRGSVKIASPAAMRLPTSP